MGNKSKKKSSSKSKPNKQVKSISLSSKLQKIYDTFNLKTTCEHCCECCKTAMPQMNYSEFVSLLDAIWNNEDKNGKLNIILRSIEYYFKVRFEQFGKDIFIKPCMFLNDNNLCKYYEKRPLSCRLYGLWPVDVYNRRVDKFEKAYEGLLTRQEIPLNKQCTKVKSESSEPIKEEQINSLYSMLDSIDMSVGGFTQTQIDNKENYRSFHDWMLLKVFGEEWLINISSYIMKAGKEEIIDLIIALKDAVSKKFENTDIELKRG